MIHAAIYARTSTDQNGVTDEEKSVARQVEHAEAWTAPKNWSVSDGHIYIRVSQLPAVRSLR